MPEIGLTLRGATGRLTSGCRLVATLWTWEAHGLPGPRRLAVRVAHAHRDPVWWGQHTQPLTVALDVGDRAWKGRAVLAQGSASEPDGGLALVMEGYDIV